MAARIAVVNQDDVFLLLISQILTVEGYDGLLLHKGQDAHATIKKERPDLVMLDADTPSTASEV